MHAALRHVGSLFSRKRPVHLTFFVTRRCNSRCPFCFYEKARDAAEGAPELSLEEIRKVARSMDALLWVLFSGGEVFLRDDIARVSEIFHDTNGAAFLTFPTNGSLPDAIAERTEEILQRCPKSVVVVKLSLDGVGAEHDALRQVPGGFDRALQTYERLASLAGRHRRLELGVNTLFCAENQWSMDGIIEFVRGLDGVRSHTVTMVRGDVDARFASVSLDQYERAMCHLEERWHTGRNRFHRFVGAGVKAAQDRLRRRLISRTLAERRRLFPCYAGRLDLVLTERGELHPCEGRWDASFGNVREAGYDVTGMVRSERGRRVLDEIANGACYCSHECNFMTNILFNPAMHPRLLGDWARLRLGWPERRNGRRAGEAAAS